MYSIYEAGYSDQRDPSHYGYFDSFELALKAIKHEEEQMYKVDKEYWASKLTSDYIHRLLVRTE